MKLPLLQGEISLSEALAEDDNMLVRLKQHQQRYDFLNHLYLHRADIDSEVTFHLGRECRVSDFEEWLSGSFNVCIPVYLEEKEKVLIRFPLPYKVGEEQNPGNAEEKLRCEAASYLWITEKCPDIPIPVLYGVGLPGDRRFTAPECLPCLLQNPTQTGGLLSRRYIPRKYTSALKSGYLIISFVSQGEMLMSSWERHHNDQQRRYNLFGGLSRIILSLNRFPQSSIGSMTMDDEGSVHLTNRALLAQVQMQENEDIPTPWKRDDVLVEAESYCHDLLQCHDNRIRLQPNAIHNEDDGKRQLAALVMMRAILHQFIDREYRKGPFLYTLTDLYPTNIFVDDEWNITSLIDLEWGCFLPIQLQCPPYWLTGKAVDQMADETSYRRFEEIFKEFLEVFEREERKNKDGRCQVQIMRHNWENGGFWYFQALQTPKGLYNIFNTQIQRHFHLEHPQKQVFDDVVAHYWRPNAMDTIAEKVEEEETKYTKELREVFEQKLLIAGETQANAEKGTV